MDEALKLAKEISKERDKTTIFFAVAIIIVYILLNIVTPIVLNFFNRKNEIQKLRSERKLNYIECLVRELYLLSSFLGITDTSNIRDGKAKINSLRKDVKINNLLLTKTISKYAVDLLDYYSIVLISPEKRDINNEEKIFLSIKKEYEKIL